MIISIRQWQANGVNEPFVQVVKELGTLDDGQALVRVAGCGVCHTDISFWHHGVRTRKDFPLTLGHEISGTVVEGPPHWVGKKVIVPAVLPCGDCMLCQTGRSNICQNQRMPGNDFDGGFASHVVVPHRFLCEVPDKLLEHHSLEQVSVIADAISTPYQVLKKSELVPGDLAIVIGVGGVGIYAALIAGIMGGRVLAIDIDDQKLAKASDHGIPATLNTRGMEQKDIRKQVRAIANDLGAPEFGWKIFEMSGTRAGQELAFNLITYASTLSIVGFTMDKVEVRLSNLMAFDAKLIGTWGCKPELYPEVVELIASGKLDIRDFVQTLPLSSINEVFRDTLAHKFTRRVVLVPDFD
ncbi:MAG: 6-hydroxycyclohex-1-ene-1-carbonyl-CoA dehydrogenase [Saprospiraceae bacterium]|nr:6-hydroxycyclohex-1-ene-1-carbonyl-CoA dehydrogenase [Saprospiraceae bacterium]